MTKTALGSRIADIGARRPPPPAQGAKLINTPARTQTPDLKIDKDLELRRDGPEDDLEL